ncbi:MAG: acyltransferase family protein [Candidatus Limnocylindrales bacterium]|nr:acyltransferase family protein [Candidatus Limnocylindrales bacterium]
MSGAIEKEGFRPDLEGLRAIAVSLVLLYHAAVPGFGGGYVGVDVFFVLSGFLISGLLLRELETTGTISLPSFYARRLRRLLPAVALLILVTVVASVIVLSPLRAADVAGDGVAASLYASNLRFALQATDYLQSELAPSPLLHLWSLGVEEQFYLFWPALLLIVTRAGSNRVRRVGVVAAAVVVASFALSLWLTTASAPWAFFSLPSRAWELGIGALLAVGAARLAALPRALAAGAGWLGLVMIGAAGLIIDTSTPFPGIAALLPTLGTALAMLPGMRRSAQGPVKLLGWRPARFLGRISYSLYLWHWPLLVLPTAVAGETLPLAIRVGLMLVAIPIAYASQRWLEDPIRHGRLVGIVPRRNLALAGALSIALASTSLGLGFMTTQRLAAATAGSGIGTGAGADAPLPDLGGLAADPTPRPGDSSPSASAATTLPPPPGGPVPAGLIPALDAARADIPTIYGDGCHLSQAATTIPECVFGDPDSSTAVVLFGDSHAAQWFPALERLAIERSWRLVSLTKSGCTPASITVWNANMKRADTECDDWRGRVLERVAADQPDLVIVASSHPYPSAGSGGPAAADGGKALAAGLEATLDRLVPLAGAVALIGDTPKFDLDPPDCLSAHLDQTLDCTEPRAEMVDLTWLETEARIAKERGAAFVDPTNWACPTDPCPTVVGRFLVYRDRHHLATPYVTALRERLAAALPDLRAP